MANKDHNTRVPLPNHNSSAEYLQSGIPYVTSSHQIPVDNVVHVSFPTVSRWFIIKNNNTNEDRTLDFGFSENGVKGTETNNFFRLDGKQSSERLEIKTKDVFVKSNHATVSFSLIAGLTSVPASSFPTLTGSLVENSTVVLPGVG